MSECKKDLKYWKNNCEEDYLTTPISVLRYISKLEEQLTLSGVSQQRKFIKKWWKYFDEESVAINCNDEEREEVITNFFNCG